MTTPIAQALGDWCESLTRSVRWCEIVDGSAALSTVSRRRCIATATLRCRKSHGPFLSPGGTVVYGGRLRPAGFTQQLINEVGRFAAGRHALTLCLPFPENIEMTEMSCAK